MFAYIFRGSIKALIETVGLGHPNTKTALTEKSEH